MNFLSIRMITADIRRLVTFYERVGGVRAHWFTDDFAEITLGAGTLAIASERTMAQFAEGAARGGANHSLIVEFLVKDVDADFARLRAGVLGEVLQEPTTMPWGNRSLLFRDPDGTLVNLYTPVTEHAKKRFEGRM